MISEIANTHNLYMISAETRAAGSPLPGPLPDQNLKPGPAPVPAVVKGCTGGGGGAGGGGGGGGGGDPALRQPSLSLAAEAAACPLPRTTRQGFG
jgi:hypothetical protein